MKPKSKFNGFVGLKIFQISFIIYSRKIINFGILKKIAHWPFFLTKMRIGQNDIKIGLQNFVQTPSKI
jgi:hypothetical protein